MASQGEALGDEEPGQPGEEDQADQPEGERKIEKGLQRLVARVDPHQGGPLALDEIPNPMMQPRGPRGGSDAHRNVGDGQPPLARLDEVLHRV